MYIHCAICAQCDLLEKTVRSGSNSNPIRFNPVHVDPVHIDIRFNPIRFKMALISAGGLPPPQTPPQPGGLKPPRTPRFKSAFGLRRWGGLPPPAHPPAIFLRGLRPLKLPQGTQSGSIQSGLNSTLIRSGSIRFLETSTMRETSSIRFHADWR